MSSVGKPAPNKSPSKIAALNGPRSAKTDVVDAIYKNEDPINTSIGIRQKAGDINSLVANPSCTMGKFFFTLRSKGAGPVHSQQALDNVQRQAGNTDAAGNILVVEPPKPDPVDLSLALRIKSGNLTNTVPVAKAAATPGKKTTKEPAEVLFKLR